MTKVGNTSSQKGALSKYQRFEIARWNRAQIKAAPYNPRVISLAAERKLKRNLKTLGLSCPIVVNQTTGNLVSGHQRLAALDALEGNSDYSLDVSVVKLTVKQEREQNLFMNNLAAQGDWDLAALASMLGDQDIKLDVEATGFSEVDLETILGEQGKGLFGEEEQPEEVNESVSDIEAALEAREEEAVAAKGRREKIRETTKAEREGLDTERIAYVFFPDRRAREDWVESLGLKRSERYVPLEAIKEFIVNVALHSHGRGQESARSSHEARSKRQQTYR